MHYLGHPFIAVLLSVVSVPAVAAPLSGKQLAFDRDKGNCLACHAIAGGESPGDIGPPLSGLKKRFKDKRQLYAQIWDAARFNPATSMPPFGRNKVLSDVEIDAVVQYLWGLP
jgi:sulfur-oxidizing protein SoxX